MPSAAVSFAPAPAESSHLTHLSACPLLLVLLVLLVLLFLLLIPIPVHCPLLEQRLYNKGQAGRHTWDGLDQGGGHCWGKVRWWQAQTVGVNGKG